MEGCTSSIVPASVAPETGREIEQNPSHGGGALDYRAAAALALLPFVAAHQRLGRVVERELSADGVAASDYALLGLMGVRGPVRLPELSAELARRNAVWHLTP